MDLPVAIPPVRPMTAVGVHGRRVPVRHPVIVGSDERIQRIMSPRWEESVVSEIETVGCCGRTYLAYYSTSNCVCRIRTWSLRCCLFSRMGYRDRVGQEEDGLGACCSCVAYECTSGLGVALAMVRDEVRPAASRSMTRAACMIG